MGLSVDLNVATAAMSDVAAADTAPTKLPNYIHPGVSCLMKSKCSVFIATAALAEAKPVMQLQTQHPLSSSNCLYPQ